MSAVPPGSREKSADDPAWRDRLLASLRDCGVPTPTRNWVLQWFITIVLLIGIAIITIVGRLILKETLRTEPDIVVGWVISIAWMLFVTFVLIRIRNRTVRTAWQTSARSAEQELLRAGFRRPILYLRSFQLDGRIGQPSWLEILLGTAPLASVEQEMTKAASRLGPVIAIGRPSEKLPPLGAARFYVSHDRWQEKVADVTKESQLVIWATGVTEGLRWEISHLIDSIPPDKLVLWAHPHLLRLSAPAREAEWTKFRVALGSLFPQPLPEKLGEVRFIYFTHDWAPRAVAPPRRIIPWSSATKDAVNAVLGVKQGTLLESNVVYPGPRPNDTLAGLIGAADPVDWRRIAVFFGALVAFRLPNIVHDPRHFHDSLIWAVIITAAAVLAFRFLRESVAPVAAAFVALLFSLLLGRFYFLADLLRAFVQNAAFFAGLAWTTRRMTPRVLALWVGACCFPLAGILLSAMSGEDHRRISEYEWISSMVGAALFALCLTIADRLLPTGEPAVVLAELAPPLPPTRPTDQ